MCRQEQQQQTQSVHQRQRSLVQSLLTGGVRGGSAAGSSRVETAQGSSFVKKWPNMTAADIEAAQVAIALAFYAGNLPHSLIELPEVEPGHTGAICVGDQGGEAEATANQPLDSKSALGRQTVAW
jgi:hypothetical protein